MVQRNARSGGRDTTQLNGPTARQTDSRRPTDAAEAPPGLRSVSQRVTSPYLSEWTRAESSMYGRPLVPVFRRLEQNEGVGSGRCLASEGPQQAPEPPANATLDE